MTDTLTSIESTEDVESFRLRARAWLADNLRRLDDAGDVFAFAGGSDTPDVIQHHRNLMRRLFDGGFSGICYPKKYGGQGLTFDHLRAFSEEALDYELPWLFANPTLCILAPTILDCGSEEQKQRHLPAILKGEELWVQFLSEPSGGSDLAGVLTRATRDGEEFVITGSKIWTSGGHRADYAQAVVRTDWDAPKHAGISVIIVPIPSDGLTIEPIKQVNGNSEFCQEFLDEVRVPASYVLGAENDGWNVTQRMLYHEKLSLGGGSPYQLVLGQPRARGSRSEDDLVALARVSGKANDPHMRQLVAEGHISGLVQQALIGRVVTGMGTGKMPAPASALLKLMGATTSIERSELIMRLAGSRVAAWPDGSNGGAIGTGFLYRQAIGILGGTNEIQRNIISERFLGMPRELAPDKGIPFKDAKRNTSA